MVCLREDVHELADPMEVDEEEEGSVLGDDPMDLDPDSTDADLMDVDL
jgi:hypothetical protein